MTKIIFRTEEILITRIKQYKKLLDISLYGEKKNHLYNQQMVYTR